MPKATKLHPKGKTGTLQKPCKVEKDGTDNVDPEESMRQFQLELCWCIQQCERFLGEKKGTEKQMQETWKVLTVLKNNNQPMIRKRQLMRTHFGDYRAKMAAEEKKLAKLASKIKISETPDKPKATFLRKSAFLTTGDDSFKFNFNLSLQDIDSGTPSTDDKPVADVSNIKHLETSNTVSSDVNINPKPIVTSTEKLNGATASSKTEDSVSGKYSNNFKFTFTETQFKFNFNVNS